MSAPWRYSDSHTGAQMAASIRIPIRWELMTPELLDFLRHEFSAWPATPTGARKH